MHILANMGIVNNILAKMFTLRPYLMWAGELGKNLLKSAYIQNKREA